MNYKFPYNVKTKDVWDERTIYDILRNPNYTGNLYQNRRKKINYKLKKIKNVSEKEWIVAYNTHEAIIDIETYKMVQNIHEKNRLQHKVSERNILLQGFMKCKECGHSIGINTSMDKTRHYTICNHYRKYPKQNFCTSHSMRYELIEEAVLKEVKKICRQFVDTKKLESIMKYSNKKSKSIEDMNNRILNAKKVIDDNTNYLHNAYIDRLKGIISLDTYQEIADKLSEEISINQNLIKELELEKISLENNKIYSDNECQKIIKEYLSLKKPSRALLANIIDKITIDKDKNIEIYYKIKKHGNVLS